LHIPYEHFCINRDTEQWSYTLFCTGVYLAQSKGRTYIEE
jgi:hypothetical protein